MTNQKLAWYDPVIEEDPALREDTAAVHDALRQLLRVYQFRDRDRICCHDVSVTQCHALEQLVEVGPMSQTALAAALYLDKSTTSRVLSALERKGYVERKKDLDDRRALRLEVTAAGRALVGTIEADILAREARLLSDFAPDVRKAMARLIGELARTQAAGIETTGGTCCTIG
jgi:MarR family transcriptional regulator, 2-MHQ and catechol-resistance regulon repressor